MRRSSGEQSDIETETTATAGFRQVDIVTSKRAEA